MAAAAPSFPSTHKVRPTLISLRVCRTVKVAASSPDPSPAFKSVTAFAPATVANLGPGFDFLGCAVADASLSLGDTVTATLAPSLPPGTVSIASVSSPSRPHLADRLSRDPLRNCAGIAAIAALRALDVRSHAVSIHLTKGLPLGSGLGSSAASAAAAAKAVDALFGSRLHRDDLVLAGLESEKAVHGFHAVQPPPDPAAAAGSRRRLTGEPAPRCSFFSLSEGRGEMGVYAGGSEIERAAMVMAFDGCSNSLYFCRR